LHNYFYEAGQGVVNRACADSTGWEGEGVMRILLVEDQPVLRDAIAQLLRSAGHEVLEAGTMISAMTLLRETKGISLVLSDGWMPLGLGAATKYGLHGLEPLTAPYGLEILTYAKAHGIPGVLWTGDDRLVERANQLGFRAVLKTITLKEMLGVVREVGA